jgi:hypothetical protein
MSSKDGSGAGEGSKPLSARIILTLSLLLIVILFVFITPSLTGHQRAEPCQEEFRNVYFDIVEQESSQVEIVYLGSGETTAEANKTYIQINEQTSVWSDIQPPGSDNVLQYGDNLTISVQNTVEIRVVYQLPPPNRSPLNPFAEPCYNERNQTIVSYEVSE